MLRVLAQQRRTIRDLYTDADTIFSQVVQRRRDVGRFVEEARDTTRAYATESASVDDQFRQLPTFLGELQPTLAALEGTAEAQRPALESLRVSARPLAALLRTTGNFSTASRPSVRALAALARSGEGNLERSLPNLKRLTSATRRLPETAGNLGIILNHLNDRDFAAERDPRSPGGRGYTGLESFLRFLWLGSQTSNWFDKDSYLLKNAQYGDAMCGEVRRRGDGQADRHAAAGRGSGPTSPASRAPTRPRAPPFLRRSSKEASRRLAGQERRRRGQVRGRRRRATTGLPPAMRRQSTASITSSPVLVGAVTLLVAIVAVFLSYNANSGLPFVPTTRLIFESPNGAALTEGQPGARGRAPRGDRDRAQAGPQGERAHRRADRDQARRLLRRRAGGQQRRHPPTVAERPEVRGAHPRRQPPGPRSTGTRSRSSARACPCSSTTSGTCTTRRRARAYRT